MSYKKMSGCHSAALAVTLPNFLLRSCLSGRVVRNATSWLERLERVELVESVKKAPLAPPPPPAFSAQSYLTPEETSLLQHPQHLDNAAALTLPAPCYHPQNARPPVPAAVPCNTQQNAQPVPQFADYQQHVGISTVHCSACSRSTILLPARCRRSGSRCTNPNTSPCSSSACPNTTRFTKRAKRSKRATARPWLYRITARGWE